MSADRRIAAAERILGIDAGSGHRVACAKCTGTGSVLKYSPTDDETDTEHASWVVWRRVHAVRVRLAVERGEEPPGVFVEPEPAPLGTGPCPQCHGVGTLSEATVARLEAEANAPLDPWLETQMRRIAESLGRQRFESGEPVEDPHLLRPSGRRG